MDQVQDEEKKEKVRTIVNTESISRRPSRSEYPLFQNFPDDTIIIGVDATEERAGGMLLLPNTKIIYFYSIDWSDFFKFPLEPQPDKFELTNVLLALEIFTKYVQKYREQWDSDLKSSLDLKTDNSIGNIGNPSQAYPGSANVEYRKFYQDIDSILKSNPYYGNWKQVSRQDKHIKMADRLSKVDHSFSKNLPNVDLPDSFPDYFAINISETDYAVLYSVAMQVPAQLRK